MAARAAVIPVAVRGMILNIEYSDYCMIGYCKTISYRQSFLKKSLANSINLNCFDDHLIFQHWLQGEASLTIAQFPTQIYHIY
jgi:hypothetical protein